MLKLRARLGTQATVATTVVIEAKTEAPEATTNDPETTTMATEANVDMLVGAMRNLNLNDVNDVNEIDGFSANVQNNNDVGGLLHLPFKQVIVDNVKTESSDQGRVFEVKEILDHCSNKHGYRYYRTVWASDNSISWEPEESFFTSEVITDYYVKATNLLLEESRKTRREIKRKLNALRGL